jgi:hypothetical protein
MLAPAREPLHSLLLHSSNGQLSGAPRRNAPDNGRLGQSEIWQIFGKMGFDDNSIYEGKVRIAAYLLVI